MSYYNRIRLQGIGHCGSALIARLSNVSLQLEPIAYIILVFRVVRPQSFKELVSRYPADKMHYN